MGAAVGAGADVGAGSRIPSDEYSELLPDEVVGALLSRLSFPLRLKRDFPKICTLSGRSRSGKVFVADRPDDFLDKVRPSTAFSQDGRSTEDKDSSDDEPDEDV